MPVQTLFSTPIWHQRLAQPTTIRQLNRELMVDIQTVEDLDKEGRDWSQKNYFAGYTSYGSMDQLHLQLAPFMELKALIDRQVRRFYRALGTDVALPEMQTCWVNVMPTGCSHALHLHPLAMISGTYYVETPKGSGRLKFEDPRLSSMMAAPPRAPFAWIEPKAGDLVLFPSWLRHEVEPNRAKHPRVSVSFNY